MGWPRAPKKVSFPERAISARMAPLEIDARPFVISILALAGRGMSAQSTSGIAGPFVARTRSASGPQGSIQSSS